MLKIREAIIVEGRYDKNTLSQIVDAPILETAGFGIFNDKEQLALLRAVAESLMEQFPKGSLCRVGGDEFVVFPAPAEGQTCEDRMRSASASITVQGYSISYGIAAHESVVGLRELPRGGREDA